jgi:hypothetical protein
MKRFIDPRDGDIEDDASSTKSRSLLSLAGSLLAEISLPKLALAWLLLIVVPALILGLAPLLASAWVSRVSNSIRSPLNSIWPILVLAILVAFGWFGGRTLFRLAESGFWSVNSLAVEPGYVTCREVLRHIVEGLLASRATRAQVAKMRALTAAAAGFVVCGLAVLVLMLVWPRSRWVVDISDFTSLHRLLRVALANSVVLVTAYLAVAALVWSVADATMAQPRDLEGPYARPDGGRIWRIAHLSDIHVVGERYGFRIESGRSGPRGNQRLRQALAQLDALCGKDPLDAILITGDLTDAGRMTFRGRAHKTICLIVGPMGSDHCAVALDTCVEYLIAVALPPVVGRKDFDFHVARKSRKLQPTPDSLNVNHAVAHHAPVVEHVTRRYDPIAHMKTQQIMRELSQVQEKQNNSTSLFRKTPASASLRTGLIIAPHQIHHSLASLPV